MNSIYNELYKNIIISVDEFLEDSIEENDPVKDYILERLSKEKNENKLDYSKVDITTVETYVKCMKWIYDNMLTHSPEVIVESAPQEIRRYVAFVVNGYHSTYFEEDIDFAKVKDSKGIKISKSNRNI